MEYISGSTPIKSIFKGSNLVYQTEESSGGEGIVTENTLSFKYLGLVNSNVTINGTLYQITASDGEPLGDDYYKYTTTLSEPLTSLTFDSGNVYELYAIPQTTNVTSFNYMFSSAMIPNLDLSGLDTSNVTSMDGMFSNSRTLQELNVTGWDVSNVTSFNVSMFLNCTSLNKLILGSVSQSTYDWWLARLTDAGIQSNVTIEYTIV